MKKTGGFTLIELIVVIGIIGILAGIAVPNLTTYKSRDEAMAKAAHEGLVNEKIRLYYINEGKPVALSSDGSAQGYSTTSVWMNKIKERPYSMAFSSEYNYLYTYEEGYLYGKVVIYKK